MSLRAPGIFALVLAVAAGTARADVRRVAVVELPPNLEEAVSTALEPWSIELVRVEKSQAPGNAMPKNAEQARALGRAQGAEAVVWITSNHSAAALWVYDAESDRVVARELRASPPYDEPTAAGVALSVKTLLRHSDVAPPEERFGAEATGADETTVKAAPPPPRRPTLIIESLAAARMRPTETGNLEPRLGLGLAWSPGFLPAPFALALLVRTGTGLEVRQPSFVGHLRDTSVTASGRAGAWIGGGFRAAGWLGPSLRFSRLDGAVLPGEQATDDLRINPSLDGGVILERALAAPLRVQLRADAGWSLRRQRFLVRGEKVLELPAFELEVGLGLAMDL